MTTTSTSPARSPDPDPCAGRASVSRAQDAAIFVVSLLAVGVVSWVGSRWTDTGSGSWYDRLDTPSWNPPGVTFGIVWTILYFLMAVAAWQVARRWRDRPGVAVAVALYAVQLLCNLAWTGLFFGLERPGWALAEQIVLLGLVAATIVAFARVSRLAAVLLVPYLAWVGFAITLNAAIVAAN